VQAIGGMEFAQVNLPVGVLIWVMIIPMLLRIDFAALGQVKNHMRGIGVTLVINWLVKPFSMALLAWIFIKHLFAPWLPPDQIDSYVAGLILLAAAPCTAMVFVWSRLTNGDPYFTLSQVALNDTIMIFAFAPIVALLLGVASITVPWDTLLTSVALYIVVPVIVAQLIRHQVLARGGAAALERLLHRLSPWSIVALLATLVLLFAFQGEQILRQPLVIALLAVPILIQVFFNSGRPTGQPRARREAQRGLPIGTDRRLKFLRAGGGGGDQPVRLQLGRRTGHRGRRADRGAGHAAGGALGQRQQGLVRGGRGALRRAAWLSVAFSGFRRPARLRPGAVRARPRVRRLPLRP
jgi:arsenical-resistance protein